MHGSRLVNRISYHVTIIPTHKSTSLPIQFLWLWLSCDKSSTAVNIVIIKCQMSPHPNTVTCQAFKKSTLVLFLKRVLPNRLRNVQTAYITQGFFLVRIPPCIHVRKHVHVWFWNVSIDVSIQFNTLPTCVFG